MFTRKEPELIDLESSEDEGVDEASVIILDIDDSDASKIKERNVVQLSSKNLNKDPIIDSLGKTNHTSKLSVNSTSIDVKACNSPSETEATVSKKEENSCFSEDSRIKNSPLIHFDDFRDIIVVDSPDEIFLSNSPNRIAGDVLKDSNQQTKKRKRKKIAEVVEILDDDPIILDDTLTTLDSNKLSEVCAVETINAQNTIDIMDQKETSLHLSNLSLSSGASSNQPHPDKNPSTSEQKNVTDISENSCVDLTQTPVPPKKKSKLTYQRPAHLHTPLTLPTSAEPSAKISSNTNIYNPHADSSEKRTGLRPIVIDGNNVGVGHGKGLFSVKGIRICINYFEKRGHRQIKVFIPHYRKNRDTFDEIKKLEEKGLLVTTPSRKVNGKTISSYDDRYIVQYAAEFGGVIVSTDNYRDLLSEDPKWRETIEKRLLMFTWVDDLLMFPHDPLGKNGPSLDDFLKFPDT